MPLNDLYAKNNPNRKIFYLLGFNETPKFLYRREPTLPHIPTKIDDPIFVDLREKRKTHFPFFFSPSVLCFLIFPLLLSFLSFFLSYLPTYPTEFYLFIYFNFGYMAHIIPCVHILFGSVSSPKQFIYFQFNLFEMNLA